MMSLATVVTILIALLTVLFGMAAYIFRNHVRQEELNTTKFEAHRSVANQALGQLRMDVAVVKNDMKWVRRYLENGHNGDQD